MPAPSPPPRVEDPADAPCGASPSETVIEPPPGCESDGTVAVSAPEFSTVPAGPAAGPAAARSADGLRPGDRLAEFTVLRELGRGAFATVYLARQETMCRLVALKVALKVGRTAGAESRSLARLDHPNIVRVYDERRLTDPPARLLYMEYLPGGTLEAVVRAVREHGVTRDQDPLAAAADGTLLLGCVDRAVVAAGQQPPEASTVRQEVRGFGWPQTVAWVGTQLASGLHSAHGRGVLHRDVKPANVLLSADGVPKLADFNLSDDADGGQAPPAGAAVPRESASFGGSPAYMSPEHLRAADPADPTHHADLDGRADLYSLAVLLWELRHGRRPWPDPPAAVDSWTAMIAAQRAARDVPLPTVEPLDPADRALDRALRRALHPDRERRPAGGAELGGRLRLALFPAAAPLFHPRPGGVRDRLLSVPVWLACAAVFLLPNAAAGVLNYAYNDAVILAETPTVRTDLERVATVVNAVAYPTGVALLLWIVRPVARGLRAVRRGKPVPANAVPAAWRLGHRAALIGAALWGVAGLIYPAVLRWRHPEFPTADAVHFFLSLVLCGGIAVTLPFFGGTAAGVLLYYPRLLSADLRDPRFAGRAARLRKLGGRYLLAAAGVPLLAATLAAARPEPSPAVLLTTIAATALGVTVAFLAYQRFEAAFAQLAVVIEEG